ncbi:hypothetical protein XANCAGTX0491_000897 [Xanthoria calcicola]
MPPLSIASFSMMPLLFLLLLFATISFGFRFPYLATGDQRVLGSQRSIDNPDTDLRSLLWTSPDSQSQIYTSALQVLEGLKSSPSCHRLAAATLIRSCQSIDGSSSDPEDSLEDEKSVYAAQLALCEIRDAGSGYPEDCEAFLPLHSAQSSRKVARSFSNADATTNALKGKLSLCLQALESRPQHWTSYSNNRQNAVVMCQAARIDVEKDNLIQLHQSLVNTTSGANSVLMRALAAANKALLKQKQFATGVENFQQQLVRDLEASKAHTQSYLRSMMKSIESALQNTVKPFSDMMKTVETEANEVQETLHSSVDKANELRSNIGKLIQQAADDHAELAAAHANTLEAISSAKALLRNDLQSMGEVHLQSVAGAFGSVQDQLRASNELVGVMHSRQTVLDGQLQDLDRRLVGLRSSATTLHEIQTADAEAQLRLSNQVQVELQVARGLIADVTASAATLQASLHDTGSKVADIMALGGLTDQLRVLGWCLVSLFGFYLASPRLARYAVLALGAYELVSMVGLPDMASLHLFGYSVPLEVLYIGLLWCCICVVVIMLYRSSSRSQQLAVSTFLQVTRRAKTSHEQPHHSCKV